MTAGEEIVSMVKGVTPYLISVLFAFCIVFCVIEEVDIPSWFIAMLGAGAGSGVTGAIVSRRSG